MRDFRLRRVRLRLTQLTLARAALVVAAFLAVPVVSEAPAFAGDVDPAELEEGLPLPPPMDLLRQLRRATAEIQDQSATFRKQCDDESAQTLQLAASNVSAGKPVNAAAPEGGLSADVNGVAATVKNGGSTPASGSTAGSSAATPATSGSSANANAAAPAAKSGDLLTQLFDALPSNTKDKIKDFVNKEIASLADKYLQKAQDFAKSIAEKLTASFPKQKNTIDSAVANAVKDGFGQAKTALGKEVDQLVDSSKTDKPAAAKTPAPAAGKATAAGSTDKSDD